MPLQICQDPTADKVLEEHPFALLAGMMLDQQYPMEHAFRGPAKVLERFGSLDPAAIADADPEEFAVLCTTPPAIHRYGRSMAGRLQQLAQVIEEQYDCDASNIWDGVESGQELMQRLQALPGFGRQKAQIFVSLLAKQRGVRPEGWESVVGDYALEGFRSVADVTGPETLQKVRDYKKAKKAERAAGA